MFGARRWSAGREVRRDELELVDARELRRDAGRGYRAPRDEVAAGDLSEDVIILC